MVCGLTHYSHYCSKGHSQKCAILDLHGSYIFRVIIYKFEQDSTEKRGNFIQFFLRKYDGALIIHFNAFVCARNLINNNRFKRCASFEINTLP